MATVLNATSVLLSRRTPSAATWNRQVAVMVTFLPFFTLASMNPDAHRVLLLSFKGPRQSLCIGLQAFEHFKPSPSTFKSSRPQAPSCRTMSSWYPHRLLLPFLSAHM